jgi:hypothetical protein|nr:MAG TPA: hypothetical protein [Caudoviricetes sp.]
MSKNTLTAEYNRRQVAQVHFCIQYMFINGFMSSAEADIFHKRLRKYQDKHKVTLTRAQLMSAGLVYNDEAKVINE